MLKNKRCRFIFSDLNKSGIKYVVLRKPHHIFNSDHKEDTQNDIDILLDVTNLNINGIVRLFSNNKGSKPVELYSNNGRYGMSYKKLPYFPPSLANKILNNRIKYNTIYIPSNENHAYSYLFHLLYHKQENSGFTIHKINRKYNNLIKQYKKYFKMFSIDKYFDISQCNNLLDIHIFLKQKNWSLNYDYLSDSQQQAIAFIIYMIMKKKFFYQNH